MKQTVKFKKTLVLLFIGALSLTTSCSSDSQDDSKQTPTIIGKWHNYKRVDNNITNTDFSDLNYEFQTNACIITEDESVKNYIYKLDGDYIKYYDPDTEALTHTDKIVTLTKDELVVANQYNDYLKYFKRL